MTLRKHPLNSVNEELGEECTFLNLRDLTIYYPNDRRLVWHVNRIHNNEVIRHDLRKALNLLGEVIENQKNNTLLKCPHLFSAGWFYAVILYVRWFKSTENRPSLKEDIFDNDQTLLQQHRFFIHFRDKYIAHYEKEIIGKTELYLTYSDSNELRQISKISMEEYLKSKHDLYDLSQLIAHVHNKINGDVKEYEKEIISYIETLADSDKIHQLAKKAEKVEASLAQNPQEHGWDVDK